MHRGGYNAVWVIGTISLSRRPQRASWSAYTLGSSATEPGFAGRAYRIETLPASPGTTQSNL